MKNIRYIQILTYLTALIAFWPIGTVIYGMIKYRKNHSFIIKSFKITNFVNALTSIMLSQIILLDTFDESYNSNLVNGIIVMEINLIIIMLDLYMIIEVDENQRILKKHLARCENQKNSV